MREDWQKAARGEDWLSWIGGPMLYDGGLFVNRSLEENLFTDSIRYRIRNIV